MNEQMLYKFSGAGNDFVVLDGRGADVSAFRHPARITALCREFRTDGLMILGPGGTPADSPGSNPAGVGYDFTMEFFNPDGSGGMMCGNGGRCIVAFADYLGLKPASADGVWHFLAPDGEHTAEILSQEIPGQAGNDAAGPARHDAAGPARHDAAGPTGNDGRVMADSDRPSLPKWTVKLKMIDVQGIKPIMGGYFLNTGTRHFVKFVPDIEGIDMEKDGPEIRWDDAFQPEGTNANFVEVRADGLRVRTFEKGVEAETLACGTGLTASALAAFFRGVPGIPGPAEIPGQAGNDAAGRAGNDDERHGRPGSAISYRLQCRRGDWLQVDFRPSAAQAHVSAQAAPPDRFTEVYLTGPAELVHVVQLIGTE